MFSRLRKDAGTGEWTVLHSLGLARRGTKPYGEIDFVILIPGTGVICLEVKGGRVRCQDGVWYSRDRYGVEHRLPRSPIAQVREAVFGLRSAVIGRFGASSEVASLHYSSAVVLPDVGSIPVTPEHDPVEVIDIDALRNPISKPIMSAMRNDARRLNKRAASAWATPKNLKLLRNYLRPDFDVALARSTTIRRSEERIIQLTEEQYDILDLLERNPRCLVEGAAGTGKTLLALEFARRAAPTVEKILLLCYNRLLGDWLAQRANDILPKQVVVASSFHRYVRELIFGSTLAEEFRKAEQGERYDNTDMFNLVYPLYGELAASESDEPVALCIIDEAQDLITAPTLRVLNAVLADGLAGGRWVMLGDFSRQALYSDSRSDWSEMLSPFVNPGRYTIAPLTRNCRNTYRIGEETALMSGFESLPYRLDRSDCLPVDYRYWKNREHQVARLRDVLNKLLRDNIPRSDVVVLSPRRYKSSVAARFRQEIAPVGDLVGADDRIAFSTIQAFKGLESPIVIVCDVENMEGDYGRSLMYVGMSRARSYLIVLLHERLQKTVAQAVQRQLKGLFG